MPSTQTAVETQKTATTGEAAVKADTTLFDRGILGNLNRARAYFVEYAKAHFPQTVKNQETGKSIGISRNGIDKFLSGRIGVEKYASGFHIPELIERAHKIAQDTNTHTIQAESIPTYEYYDSPIQIEGVDYMAHIRVRNTLMGDKYYGHTISEVDNIEVELSARTSVPGDTPAVQPVNAIDNSINSIPQTTPNVNAGAGKDMATPASQPVDPLIADIRSRGVTGKSGTQTAVERQSTTSTAIDTNPATHTPEQQAVIEAYQADTDETLKEVFQGYLDNPNQGFSRHNISSVSQRQAQDAERLLGGTYKGYRNAINSNGIQHILREHGPSGTVDHTLGDLNDIARMGYVLDNYDNVELVTYESGDADYSREFRDKNDRPAPMLKFSKRVDGTYYVVEAIPESKHKKFWVVSAYMEKADGGTQAPNVSDPRNTPNASLASSPSASESSIPQTAQNVNVGAGKAMAAPASQPVDPLIADIRAKGQGTKKIAPQGVEKLSIVDDADPAGYNITKMEKGAVTDGAERRTQLDGAAGEGIRGDLPGHYPGDESGWTPRQGDLRNVAQLGLSDGAKRILQQRGVVTVDMEISADKAAFSHLLDEARVADIQNGWAVTPKTAEELAECRTFISADGGVGFAIAPDGDIEAVFRNRGRHQAGQSMWSVIPQAIAAGGTKLDCYGEQLVRIYGHSGFVPVARVTFNPEFANPGWTADKGTPDIYVMMATDTDPDIIVQKQGSYHYWTDAELAALPLMEYDDAMSYRDRLLAEQLSSKGGSPEIGDGAPNSVGAAAEAQAPEIKALPQPAAQEQATAAGNVDPLIQTIREQGKKVSSQNFQKAVDAWDGNSRTVFDVGRTSKALQSFGVKDQTIRLQSYKVTNIINKHAGMTKEIIKQAPEILESPVLVAKSKTHDTRIVVFGEVFDANGAPVLAALELQPTTKGGEVVDVINLSSLYGKDKNPADFIRTSDIIFLDQNKNRTETWLQRVGLQLPSDTTTLGSIGRITYQDGKVKVEGVPIFQQTTPGVNPETGTPQAASQPIDPLIADIRAKGARQTVSLPVDPLIADIRAKGARQAEAQGQTVFQPVDPLIADIRAKGQGTKKIAPQGVEKLSIVDDADSAGYNITKMEKGAVTDGAERRTQLDGTAGEGIPGLSQFDRGRESKRGLRQGDISALGRLGLSEDKAGYSLLLDEARATDPINGWAVTPKTKEELDGCRVFLTKDGGVGFAIAQDGDIEAVFRNKQRHPAGRAMKAVLPQAIAEGGTKLDCYGRGLVNIYVDSGFVPVARVAFNPEFANPGWNESKRRPDIYVMMATDTDPDIVRSKQGSYPAWTQAQLDALPLMEYDEAMAYRDRLLAEQLSSKGGSPEIGDGAPNSVGAAAEGQAASQPIDPLIANIRSKGARQTDTGATANLAKVAGTEKGLVYDDYVKNELAKETADRINALAKRLNLRVRFVDSIANGVADGQIVDADIQIAKDAQNPIMVVLGHEVGHWLEKTAPKEYQTIQQFVSQRRQEEINYRIAEYEAVGKALDYDAAQREFANDYIGEMIANPETLNRFINENRENRSLLQKVADALRALWQKLTGRERQQVKTAEDALLAALRASEKQTAALEKAGQTMDFSTEMAEAGAEYSIRFDEKGAIAVLEGKFDSDRKAVYSYLQGLVSKDAFAMVLADAQEVYIGKDLPGEYTQSESTKALFERIRKDKFRASHILNDMLLIGENVRWAENKGGKHGKAAKNGWYYYTTRFATPVFNQDGSVRHYNRYSAQLVVRNDADGKSYLYDVTNIQRESSGIAADGFAEPTIVTRAPSDENSVP